MSGAPYITTRELNLLNEACKPIAEAFGHKPYLVGSVNERADWHDIDIRLILPDEEFDRIFAGSPTLWSYVCRTMCDRLVHETGMPVDFQIQRRTEANAKPGTSRNPLGTWRIYAAGGDATNFGDKP